jgi:hypothetical protein
LDFYTGYQSRLAVTNSGSVVVDPSGLSQGSFSLNFDGSISASRILLFGGPGSGEGITSNRTDTFDPHSRNGLSFFTNSQRRMLIDNAGNIWSDNGRGFLVPSDARLKNVKGRFDRGLQAILALNTIRFEYTPDNPVTSSTGEHVGVIAQELEKVIPEAVTRNEQGYLGVSIDPVFWTMVNAVQEQAHEVDTLRVENADLRARLSHLEDAMRQALTRLDGVQTSARPDLVIHRQ